MGRPMKNMTPGVITRLESVTGMDHYVVEVSRAIGGRKLDRKTPKGITTSGACAFVYETVGDPGPKP